MVGEGVVIGGGGVRGRRHATIWWGRAGRAAP
jgi:hypothetical protein